MEDQDSQRMHLLLRAPVSVMLWKLATPNVLLVLSLTAVTISDAWFVGQLGTVALASLALAFPFLTLIQITAGGAIGGGITSSLARSLGGDDIQKAEAGAWHGIILGFILSLIYMVVLGFFSRPIFSLLGGADEVLEGAVTYAQIAFGGAATTVFLFVLPAILRGTGDTLTPARAIIVSSMAQIVLSGVLTIGWGPVPSLGIAGPALAMLVCQGSASAYLALHLISGNATVRLYFQKFRWTAIADIMKVGGIGLFNSFFMAMTVVLVTGFIGHYGTEALAGYGLGARLELMMIPLIFGIGGALTAGVGANFGAGNILRAKRIAWVGAGVVLTLVGAIGITVSLIPNLWLDLFIVDKIAYEYGALYLVIVAPFYSLFGAGNAFYFASQGTGNMGLPVLVSGIRFITVAIIGSIAVANSWDVSNIFIGVSVGLAVFGVGEALCLFSPGWNPKLSGKKTTLLKLTTSDILSKQQKYQLEANRENSQYSVKMNRSMVVNYSAQEKQKRRKAAFVNPSARTAVVELGSETKTLEHVAEELIRPMLRLWLDENLSPLVKQLVKKEIKSLPIRNKGGD